MLEVHYHNPKLNAANIDSSGVSISYTPQLRTYNAGVLMLGDVGVSEYPIPGGQSAYHIEADCPSECTSLWKHPITVIADGLHMHEYGTMIWSTVWHNGQRIKDYLNRAEWYQFSYQQITPLVRVIQPGDRINTHCVYDTSSVPANESIYFGSASTDEMCLEFLSYYPRMQISSKNYEVCGKLRGNFALVNGTTIPIDNPNKKFATICGTYSIDDIQFDTNNQPLYNPTAPDPPGDIERTFAQIPISCTAIPSLPNIVPADDAGNDYYDFGSFKLEKDTMVVILGSVALAGIISLIVIGVVYKINGTKRKGYDPY